MPAKNINHCCNYPVQVPYVFTYLIRNNDFFFDKFIYPDIQISCLMYLKAEEMLQFNFIHWGTFLVHHLLQYILWLSVHWIILYHKGQGIVLDAAQEFSFCPIIWCINFLTLLLKIVPFKKGNLEWLHNYSMLLI